MNGRTLSLICLLGMRMSRTRADVNIQLLMAENQKKGKESLQMNFKVLIFNTKAVSTPEGHYAGRISKRSFISTVISTFHTDPSRKRSFSNNIFVKLEESENRVKITV